MNHRIMAERFRGYLPVVIDVETGGFNAQTDALLEIAAVLVELDSSGALHPREHVGYQVMPFEQAHIAEKSLEITGIDPYHPLRPAIPEKEALLRVFRTVRREIRRQHCQRAILVGHNAFFDLGFLNAAVERSGIKRNPFHPFSSFDTVTLGGVVLGQTVLARAVKVAGLDYDKTKAHTAAYDASITADLFCYLVNECGPLFRSFAHHPPSKLLCHE